MTPIVISNIGGQCPCQADGAFYGNPFYFRARYGEWTIEVARPGRDPVCNPELFFMEGEDPDEGYMEIPDAMKEIGKAFEAFTEKYSQQIYNGKDWPDLSLPNVKDQKGRPETDPQAPPRPNPASFASPLLGGSPEKAGETK